MKDWKLSKDEIRRIEPDIEMASALSKMIEMRIQAAKILDKNKFTSIIIEDYYGAIKEYITAMMAIDGYKTLSHEVLIGYLKEFCKEFPESEVIFTDNLRKLRNKITYEGFMVNPDFLQRNEKNIDMILLKLSKILKRKLKGENA